jgi:concanavalin A-like lectin/glucanase superfamily protein
MLGAAVGSASAPATVHETGSGTARGLVFWNKLGSAYQVTHSAVGPKLALFDCHDRATPHFGARCSIDVQGKLAFVRGVTGRAATIGGGPSFPEARVHTALLRASIFNPEHGAVEAWYRQIKDPEPFVDNPHRILGGPYDLGSGDVSLYAQDAYDSGDPRLHFVVFFARDLPNPRYVEARSVADRQRGYRVSALNGRWIHLAGVWDRNGIDGSDDTVRLYVNGAVVAVSHRDDWGTRTCSMRKEGCLVDVAGCNDTCRRTFAVDELKVWNYARTVYPAQRRGPNTATR